MKYTITFPSQNPNKSFTILNTIFRDQATIYFWAINCIYMWISKMNKMTDLMNHTCRLMHQHSLQAHTNRLYSGNISQNLQKWEAQIQNVQTASMPLEENEEEKPRPIPLCVCVCDRAISYWTSRLRNISSCCCKVLRPSSLPAPDEPPSSSPYSKHNRVIIINLHY